MWVPYMKTYAYEYIAWKLAVDLSIKCLIKLYDLKEGLSKCYFLKSMMKYVYLFKEQFLTSKQILFLHTKKKIK